MESRDQTRRVVGLTKSRIEALTDGIFAFAMTLLVTGMDLPTVTHPLAEGSVQNILMELFPDFVHYVIAFVTLAGFWFIHHVQYHHIRYLDRKLLWISIMSLLFIALVPFSTSLAGDFPQDRLASLVLEANLLVIGLASYWQWSYACSDHQLVDPSIDKATVVGGKRRGMVVPAVSVFAIMLSILSIPWSSLVYFLVPAMLTLIPSGGGHERLSANNSGGTNSAKNSDTLAAPPLERVENEADPKSRSLSSHGATERIDDCDEQTGIRRILQQVQFWK